MSLLLRTPLYKMASLYKKTAACVSTARIRLHQLVVVGWMGGYWLSGKFLFNPVGKIKPRRCGETLNTPNNHRTVANQRHLSADQT